MIYVYVYSRENGLGKVVAEKLVVSLVRHLAITLG